MGELLCPHKYPQMSFTPQSNTQSIKFIILSFSSSLHCIRSIGEAPLRELHFGHLLHDRVERQHGSYYRLTITPENVDSGFLIHAYSKANNKFKLLVFDTTGEVHHIADSKQNKTISEACLHFTPFDTYSLTEAPSSDLPYLFTSLEHFTPSNIALPAGHYVLCVYGDNFIGKSSVDIVALPVDREGVEVYIQ